MKRFEHLKRKNLVNLLHQAEQENHEKLIELQQQSLEDHIKAKNELQTLLLNLRKKEEDLLKKKTRVKWFLVARIIPGSTALFFGAQGFSTSFVFLPFVAMLVNTLMGPPLFFLLLFSIGFSLIVGGVRNLLHARAAIKDIQQNLKKNQELLKEGSSKINEIEDTIRVLKQEHKDLEDKLVTLENEENISAQDFNLLNANTTTIFAPKNIAGLNTIKHSCSRKKTPFFSISTSSFKEEDENLSSNVPFNTNANAK